MEQKRAFKNSLLILNKGRAVIAREIPGNTFYKKFSIKQKKPLLQGSGFLSHVKVNYGRAMKPSSSTIDCPASLRR